MQHLRPIRFFSTPIVARAGRQALDRAEAALESALSDARRMSLLIEDLTAELRDATEEMRPLCDQKLVNACNRYGKVIKTGMAAKQEVDGLRRQLGLPQHPVTLMAMAAE